ncbi:DNA-binding transcriptional regulator LsrR, DeoR family [Orenia metallireducens]|uniref:DNA-binding transcriptional regulator LsrR, DeoR family n=1 Tax=Orenia metallireducens TaxID=1413210 RepID=A0A285HPG0_9FIRM|nr:sugar-binding transcriptional regulator [Orenia metallireducens]SNY36646.1 DNA-binding transcriptional regulator LsrR, DeoR family [Orenia metallireducens]
MPTYEPKLMAKVAELYYKYDMSQQEIADRIKISRVKVSRVLTAARKEGIIEVKINYPKDNATRLERKFEEKFGLKEAKIIVNQDASEEVYFNEVAKTAAKHLSEKVSDGDILGVSWGSTLRRVTDYVEPTNKEVDIVQLIGNLGSNDVSANTIIHNLARAFGGEYNILPAPAIVDNKAIRDAIISDRKIKEVFEMMNQITVAMLGIGGLKPVSTFIKSGYLLEEDMKLLNQAGAIGDVCARFFDINGERCNATFDDRVIGVGFKQLKEIPYVMGVVSGAHKAEAILGVLRSGAIDVLITDEITALAVLELL